MSETTCGLHVASEFVALAAVSEQNGKARIVFAESIPCRANTVKELAEERFAALKDLLAKFPSAHSRCVVSLAPERVISVEFDTPPNAKEKDRLSAAMLYSDSLAPEILSSNRAISLDKTGNPGVRLLSISSKEEVEKVADLARSAGLTPIVCDVPLAAWQRVAGGNREQRSCDALLDLSALQATLFVFPKLDANGEEIRPIGKQIPISTSRPEKTASQLHSTFVDLRRDDIADVSRLAIFSGDDAAYAEILNHLKSEEGLDVFPYAVLDKTNPQWAFAAALAAWDIEPTALRANLLTRSASGRKFSLASQFRSSDFGKMAAAFFAALALAGIYGLYMHHQQTDLQQQSGILQSRITSSAAAQDRARRLMAAEATLEDINREAIWLRYNDRLLALDLARLANDIPPDAWLDSLDATANGWTLAGGTTSLDAQARLIEQLGSANPTLDTRFTKQTAVGFNLTITATPSPPPPPPPPTPAADASPGATTP